MKLTLVTPAIKTPITLDDAKEHLGITASNLDGLVTRKLCAATEYCQRRISGHRQFMTATYDGELEQWPERIEVDVPPLQSVTSLKYVDSDGVQQTLSSTAYTVLTPTDDPGSIVPAYGQVWPSARAVPNAITVRFDAGYASQAVVPETIKEAVRQMTAHFFANRGPEVVGTITAQLANGVDRLLGCNEYGDYD